MASYELNSIDLAFFGIIPGHAAGSNIAVAGVFDMPARIGVTHYEWADDNSVEPYVSIDDIFFGGRDLQFHCSIIGDSKHVNDNLEAFYEFIELFDDLVKFKTPYGDFQVQVKTIIPEIIIGGCKLVITFREPVVNVSGILPAIGADVYNIDNIPMQAFGLYYGSGSGYRSLSELKEQLYTKYGAEGYQMTRRKARSFGVRAFVAGESLQEFRDNIQALMACFAAPGMREIIINNEISVQCFAVEGFSVSDVHLFNQGAIAKFNMDLIATKVKYVTADTTLVTADDELITVDSG